MRTNVQKSIPKDTSTRIATDPFSKKQIDESTAIIVIKAVTAEHHILITINTYANYINQF